MSRLVAATICTSIARAAVAPIRRTVFSSTTFRNLAWSDVATWPISSRKMVPPSAVSNRPGRVVFASVKAPRSWPNSSASTRCSGSAVQLTSMKGPSRRPPAAWIARATCPLPAPVSPSRRTVGAAPRGAVARARRATSVAQAGHGRRIAHDRARAGLALPVVGDLALRARGADRALDAQPDLVEVEGLEHEIARALLHRLHGVRDRAVGGHHDDRDLRLGGEDLRQRLDPAAVGKPQVQQDDLGARLLDGAQSLGDRAGLPHDEAAARERLAEIAREDGFVLDDHHGRHPAPRLRSRRPGGKPSGEPMREIAHRLRGFSPTRRNVPT